MEILSITVPIFIFVAAGYVLRQKGIIGVETRNFLSRLVYYFAFPALTFKSIVSFNFASTFRLKLVAHNILVTCMVFVFAFLVSFMIKNARSRGAFNMSCFRSNQGYMGLPVVNGFYGGEAMSRAAVVNGFDSPVVIILSVFALEIFRGRRLAAQPGNDVTIDKVKEAKSKEAKSKEDVRVFGDGLVSFITNPFIITSVLGLVLSYFRVPVLKIGVLDEFLKVAGGMALPLALISIGCSIEIKHLKNSLMLVLGASIVKLLIMPVLAFFLAYFLFDFRSTDLGMSVILTATPTSVSSYIMACEMDTDEELSATTIGFTTFISVITISLIQYVLKNYFL